MTKFSEKIYLTLTPPTEEAPVSDLEQLLSKLSEAGFANARLLPKALQTLHTACLEENYHITATLVFRENGWSVTHVDPGDTRGTHYGLAVDYGSTTIVMQLVDMNSGKICAQAREMSGQIAYGTDILTRITYTMEDPRHMDDLHAATVETFHRLFQQLTLETGISVKDCPILILSGNTTMIHFLLKLDARTVFFSPYAPVTLNPGWFTGVELGMDFSGIVYIIPAVSNYVGGDITSGLLTMDFYHKDEIGLFFDIGTNGELVIGNKDWLLAGAGAAGPALEGYISKFGMRAQNGAIDTVTIHEDKLFYTTIGSTKPVGICGSGIIDLLASMRINGWINIAGKLEPEASPLIQYLDSEEEYVVVYASEAESETGELLYFSQTDIDQYLDTKAAAYTMIDCLLSTAGCSKNDVSHIFLSGAFCAHSDLESAITIGIFPDLPRERYTAITNSSLDGARTLLLNLLKLKDIQHLLDNIYCVQFASIPDFLIRMQAAKFIPHTNMEDFPSIEEKIQKARS